MRLRPALALCICLVAPLVAPVQTRPGAEWRGKLVIERFNFVYGTGQKYVYGPGGTFEGTKPLVARRVEPATRDYDLYQGRGGVVREQLTRATGQRSIGPPRDIRLLDYHTGSGLVFDKDGTTAMQGPLTPPAAPLDIGKRKILGFACYGKKYVWRTSQGATVELAIWTPAESGMIVPLLEVEYFTDKTEALLGLTVQFVSQIEPASNLPESLFQRPKGLRVTNVPFVQ